MTVNCSSRLWHWLSLMNVLSACFDSDHQTLLLNSILHHARQTFDQSRHSSLISAQCSQFAVLPRRQEQWHPFGQWQLQSFHQYQVHQLRWQQSGLQLWLFLTVSVFEFIQYIWGKQPIVFHYYFYNKIEQNFIHCKWEKTEFVHLQIFCITVKFFVSSSILMTSEKCYKQYQHFQLKIRISWVKRMFLTENEFFAN